jgi:two-component system response regulator DevR
VFLLDDHESVRRGLRELLEDEPDIEVMTRAAPGGSCAAPCGGVTTEGLMLAAA